MVAFSHVSLFCPNSLPGSYEQGHAQKLVAPYVQNSCCEEKASFVKRIHLQKLLGLAGSLPLPFPFFFPPLEEMQEEQHLLETFVLESWDSLHFQNNLLQKCLQWVGAVGARGAPPCLHAVSRQQCNTAATTSIISPLICGSGTHTGTGCSRMRVHVSETSCKQLHKNVVIRNVPVDLNMGHFYRASGGAGFWSQGQRARKCVLPVWT